MRLSERMAYTEIAELARRRFHVWNDAEWATGANGALVWDHAEAELRDGFERALRVLHAAQSLRNGKRS